MLTHVLHLTDIMRRSLMIAALAWALPVRAQPVIPPGLLDYAASALGNLIDAARQQAIADGVRPMPATVYRGSAGLFPAGFAAEMPLCHRRQPGADAAGAGVFLRGCDRDHPGRCHPVQVGTGGGDRPEGLGARTDARDAVSALGPRRVSPTAMCATVRRSSRRRSTTPAASPPGNPHRRRDKASHATFACLPRSGDCGRMVV